VIDPSEAIWFVIPIAITGAACWIGRRFRRGRLIGIALGGLGLLLLAFGGCGVYITARCSPFVSPGGKYIARSFTFNGGATESFHAFVEVPSDWNPFAHTVFDSDYDPRQVQLGWLGPDHLLIKYPQRTVGDRLRCLGGSPGVEVTCEPLDNGPAARPSTKTSPPEACTSGF
jgi:hypothetical protein